MVETVAVLSEGVPSTPKAETVAELLMVPVFTSRATMATLTRPVSPTLPKSQVTVPLVAPQEPWDGFAEMNVLPAGKVSMTRTPPTGFCSVFVTVIE